MQTKTVYTGIRIDYLILGLISIAFAPFLWAVTGFISAIQISLTVIWGGFLFIIGYKFVRNNDWPRITAELITPGVLWLLFGLGGIINIYRLEGLWYYGPYDDTTVLFLSIYTLIGSIFYILAFRFSYRNLVPDAQMSSMVPESRIRLFLLLLITFDWFMRLNLIRRGLYFTWIRRVGFDESVLGTNMFYHIQRTLGYIILPLLLYYFLRSRWKWLFGMLIVVQVVIIALQGDRVPIIIALMILIFSYLTLTRKVYFKLVSFAIIGVIFFLGFFGPMLQEARYLMRDNASYLLANPREIPVLFLTEYLPSVTSLEIIKGESYESRRTISLVARMGSYMSYAASMYQSMMDGTDLQSWNDFRIAISQVVPRFLYPAKPSLDADEALQQHFFIGYSGLDAHGTPAADIFSYLHLPGIIILYLLTGTGYGFVARHLRNNYGIIGDLILIGLFFLFVPAGDSFSQDIANLRNVLLFLIGLKIIFSFGVNATKNDNQIHLNAIATNIPVDEL